MDTTCILRRNKVRISTDCFDNARLFRVRCDVANRSTMLELYDSVAEALDSGLKTIAVSFTSDSYLFSEIIPHLLKINTLAESRGAMFCLVENNPELRSVLDRIGITRMVKVVASSSFLSQGADIF